MKIMRSVLLRPIFNVATVNAYIIRSISVTREEIDVNDNVPLKSWKKIPGPEHLPLIGCMHHHLPGGSLYNLNGKDLSKVLYDKYGPIVRLDGVVGLDPFILLYDAESSSQILRGENLLPVRVAFKSLDYYRNNVKKDKKPGSPSGLSSDQGELWKELRVTVNPILLQPKTMKLYDTVLDEVSMDMIERLRFMRDDKDRIQDNFDQEMDKWALESVGVVALGCRLNCLDPNLPDDSPAKKLIQCVHDLFVTTDQIDLKPNIWKWFATPTFKTAMKLYEEQENLAKFFIDRAMHEYKTKTKTADEKSVLEKLLEINEDIAVTMATDMLSAGVDTAANSITGALYLLAKNPEKQNKLREELLLSPDKRPYLRATIKEAIRMMPVVSGNMRTTTKEYNIMGYKIPSGMNVVFSHQDMSMMEEHFPRANEFLPERWMADKDDPISHRNAHPFAYNPFGFGVRSCIGRRIAELQIETFLARLVENFHIQWFGGPPKVVQTTLNYVKGPFCFIFKDVKK